MKVGLKEMAQKKLYQTPEINPEEIEVSRPVEKWEYRNLDPRIDDLNGDHVLWHYFLNACLISRPDEPDLLAGLIFVRAMGAQIKKDNNNLVIRPVIDETGRVGWVSPQAYQLWLEKHNFKRFFPVIVEILSNINKMGGEQDADVT